MNNNTILLVILAALSISCTSMATLGEKLAKDGYIVSAYVWPSCHDDARAREWIWEDGIGEWQIIKKATTRYEGHYQPKEPLWGYEMDDDPQVVEKWIQTALKYGVNTFCYDWYWFKDPTGYSGPFLESALDNGFLGAPSNEKMNFYLMWANHTVAKNYWNCYRYGEDRSLLFDPFVDWCEFKKIVSGVIAQYFSRPNYLKFDGRPVFAIFDIRNFIDGFGSEEDAAKAMEYFREQVVKAGFPGLYFLGMSGNGFRMTEENKAVLTRQKELLKIDGYALYNMGNKERGDEDYIHYGENSIKIRCESDEFFGDIPFFPCVSIGWDDTPRYPHKTEKDLIRYNRTPENFAGFLKTAKEYADSHSNKQPKMININAWNEWIEDSYLLPDIKYNFSYLETVYSVFTQK